MIKDNRKTLIYDYAASDSILVKIPPIKERNYLWCSNRGKLL